MPAADDADAVPSRWTLGAEPKVTPAILATCRDLHRGQGAVYRNQLPPRGLGVHPIYVDDEQARRARPVLCLGVLRAARRKPLHKGLLRSKLVGT